MSPIVRCRLLLIFSLVVGLFLTSVESTAELVNSSNEGSDLKSNTVVECKADDDCSSLYPLSKIKLQCSNNTCTCSGSTIKVNKRCVDVLGLPCSAIGHCEYYVDNAICDLTGSGRCVCKNGFFEEEEWFFRYRKCSPILGRPCDSNAKCHGIINTECVAEPDKPGQQQACRCIAGLRPNNPRDRKLALRESPQKWFYMRDEDDISTSCEVAIGNDCESDSCCSKYVEHSHCNISEKLCACNKGYVFSPLSKLCQKIELVYHKQKSQPLITPVAGNFHQLKTFCNDTFCVDTTPHFHPTTLGQGGKARSVLSNQCFLMYFPCLVQNSVCTPHPSNPYQGYCACQAGYTADGEDACVPDKGDTVGLIPPDTEESAVQSTTAETEITTVSPTESGTTAEETTSTTSSDSFETSTEPAHVNPFPDKVSCGRPGTTKSSEFGLSSYFSVRTKKSVDSDSLHRIVGGQDALQNEICWQAGVISFASDMQSYEYCGGTILSERWVLTAMHCVVENTDVAQPTPISRIFVSIGATNFPASALSTGSVCGSYLKVQEVIIHPTAAFIQDETDQFVGISDDLALIKLEGTLNFSLPCICPLCLTPKRPKPEETCIVSGYGCQDAACESPPPHSLAWLKVAIEKKNSSRCQHGSSRLRSDRIVCIGSTLTADACSGDSGGPLACFDPREHRFYLAGATSYGFGTPPNKCASGELARYTDVPAYVDWIANVTQTEVVT